MSKYLNIMQIRLAVGDYRIIILVLKLVMTTVFFRNLNLNLASWG